MKKKVINKKDNKKKKIGKWLYWTPRVLSILFILFIAMFSLDIFEGNYGFWGTILGLFMHNIPSLILLAVLIVSWRRGIIAGVVFIAGGILYITTLLITALMNPPPQWYMLSWPLIIAGSAFLIGIFFILDWLRQKKKKKKKK